MERNCNLKIYRIRAGLTQLELANKLGVKERIITFLETGRSEPEIELACGIGKVLNVEPGILFPEMFDRLVIRYQAEMASAALSGKKLSTQNTPI